MREIRQSGSEGGAGFNPSSLPLYEISILINTPIHGGAHDRPAVFNPFKGFSCTHF
jgi:hypothetical protein